MAVRCDCVGKFVSLEMCDEPEEQDCEIDGGGVSVVLRVFRTCGECGDEKQEYTAEMSEDIEDALIEHNKAHHELDDENEYEKFSVTSENSIEESKKGWVVKAEYTVTCDECETETATITNGLLAETIVASDFDEV